MVEAKFIRNNVQPPKVGIYITLQENRLPKTCEDGNISFNGCPQDKVRALYRGLTALAQVAVSVAKTFGPGALLHMTSKEAAALYLGGKIVQAASAKPVK